MILKAPSFLRKIPFIGILTVPVNLPYLLIPLVFLAVNWASETYENADSKITDTFYFSDIIKGLCIIALIAYYIHDSKKAYFFMGMQGLKA